MLKRLILLFFKPLFRNHVYTLRHGLGKGFKIKGGLGFLKPSQKAAPEELFLLNRNFDGKTIYDIGSYVGVTTMFFAKAVGKAGKVIAFEPNPANAKALKQNLALNDWDNIMIMEAGVGEKRETKTLMYDPDALATGSMDDAIQAQLMRITHAKVTVEIYPLDHYVDADILPVPDFVKIDVEGMEYEVLRGMKNIMMQHRPELYIELHGVGEKDKMANAQKVFELLESYNYTINHVETGQPASAKNIHNIKEGHFSCT